MTSFVRTGYRNIARVVKTHGRHGEVVAVPADGLPPVLCEGMHVVIVPPLLKKERFHDVLGADDGGETGQLISLSDVASIGDAEELVGRYVLALEEELPPDLDLYDPHWLLGREVADEARGSLGCISEVLRGPANDTWVIEGEGGTLMFPVVEHLLVDVPEEGPILVSAREEDLLWTES